MLGYVDRKTPCGVTRMQLLQCNDWSSASPPESEAGDPAVDEPSCLQSPISPEVYLEPVRIVMDAKGAGDDVDTLVNSNLPLRRVSSVPLSSPSLWVSKEVTIKKPGFKIILPGSNPAHGSNGGTCERTSPYLCNDIPTPPDEPLPPQWNVPDISSAAYTLSSEPEIPSTVPENSGDQPQPIAAEASNSMLSQNPPMAPLQGSGNALMDAVKIAVSSLNFTQQPNNTFKIVTQILPRPTLEDEGSFTTSIFGSLMSSLQSPSSDSPRWLHVTHALPERSPMKDIPTSPPTTPSGMPNFLSQDDYFDTRNIINTAAIMVDRHDPFASKERSIVPTAPALISPPSSADISLYERIIPPSTLREFQDLFKPLGPSGLVDRLMELACMGSLIFIYPTKVGAFTFQNEHLNPALDPLIRSVVFGKGLPAESCRAIGRVETVAHMLPFDELQSKLKMLVQSLNSMNAESTSSYSLAYAKAGSVEVRRKVWEQWWIQQESARVKFVMEQYFKRIGGGVFYKDEHFTASGLAREVLEGLVTRGKLAGDRGVAHNSIEVGVFVIRRDA